MNNIFLYVTIGKKAKTHGSCAYFLVNRVFCMALHHNHIVTLENFYILHCYGSRVRNTVYSTHIFHEICTRFCCALFCCGYAITPWWNNPIHLFIFLMVASTKQGKPTIGPVPIIQERYYIANIDLYQTTKNATNRKAYFLGCKVFGLS